MKLITSSFFISCLLLLGGCDKKSNDHHSIDEPTENSPNQALYDQVMEVHDEVMPKMNDLYQAKTKLTTRLKETPGLSENEKKEIQDKISRLDSANESMMVWMRQFDPIPDSLGEEKAKAYLETELVKVNKVKENILEALKDAESDN